MGVFAWTVLAGTNDHRAAGMWSSVHRGQGRDCGCELWFGDGVVKDTDQVSRVAGGRERGRGCRHLS